VLKRRNGTGETVSERKRALKRRNGTEISSWKKKQEVKCHEVNFIDENPEISCDILYL